MMMPPERLRHGSRCVVEESHAATISPASRHRNWFSAAPSMDPNEDLTVIVLTQRMFESGEPPALHTDYQAAAYAALGKHVPRAAGGP